ncbi:calcium-dependent phosphotriesterase [Aspergillus uvarum CBS 121591]|uniref:Calcium-dependent phosphotriesterase n=1 Tax=Aspergillus uvarum CBS 121591 TaxID=1448315 RepID=A0A319CIU8_9EURO|nr:calcium-dependent phosphotriesterase [Aspergillus uvarum CBS 121591]PYH75328.1 calcium-dependent phosphotriesterase [Aspergillus uvarum CBS 121591]
MSPPSSPFQVHDRRFDAILGSSPQLELLASNPEYPFAHEAGIYLPTTNQLFITSSRYTGPDGQPKIQITRINLSEDNTPVTYDEIPTDIPFGNGGINYSNGDKGILICGQGSLTVPSGLYHMSTAAPYTTTLLKGDFYGRPFNSVNDVVVHSDGSVWFTDPSYGFAQGFRPPPRLPNQVYRWDPSTGNTRVVADGFGMPNGICFAPDETVVYITDTQYLPGTGGVNERNPATIYAFDVVRYHDEPFLTNRRVFAMTDAGIPDGIKCDTLGNVYSGCGDGIHVWSPGGVLLGRIRVQGGVANFCFGKGGEIFALNEHRLWRVKLGGHVRGALLGI